MSTTYRAFGPFNGIIPQLTGQIVSFLRDPKKMPFLRYTQLQPVEDKVFLYFKMHPDDAVQMVNINEYAWAHGDYRPSGRGWSPRGQMIEARVTRWDFPYQLDEDTISTWKKQKLDLKALYNAYRANHAALHRATRVVTQLKAAFTGAQTSDLNTLLGTVGASYAKSSGNESLPGGTDNPNFQVIKKSFQLAKKKIGLATNMAVTGEEHYAVMGPAVAQKIAVSGEIVNFLKQSTYARDLTHPNFADWSLPESYGGFKLVVEDTVASFINQIAAGTVADITVAAQKNFILDDNAIYFVSRVGGLDSTGGVGAPNYSTLQVMHYGGEARVEMFSEPKHELIEGHVVMEDVVLCPAPTSGFQITGL